MCAHLHEHVPKPILVEGVRGIMMVSHTNNWRENIGSIVARRGRVGNKLNNKLLSF